MKLSDVCIADLNTSAEELNQLLYKTEKPYVVFNEDPESGTAKIEKFLSDCDESVLTDNVPRISGKSKFLDGANKIRDLSLYRKFPDKSGAVDMTKDFHCVPVVLQASVFSTAAIREAGLKFDSRFEFLKEELFSVQFAEKYPKYYFINNIVCPGKLIDKKLCNSACIPLVRSTHYSQYVHFCHLHNIA